MPDRKVIVVTGASSGIGRALALQAARSAYAVVAVSRDKPELEQVCAEIVNDAGTCVPITLDVTAKDAPERIVTAAQIRFGRIDVLVHCAGAAIGGMLLDQTDAQIDGQWALHVAAPLRITRAAFPLLKASGGQVMFVGSGLRRVPAPYYGAYCAAKAAVETLATQLRRELRGTGVAVTFVDPGSVRTNFAKNAGIPAYGPSWVPVKPEVVAAKMMRAIQHRPWRLLAVPWHTLGAILGEWFPYFADNSVTPPNVANASPSHPEPVEGRPSLSRPHDPVEAPPSHPEPVEGRPSLSRPHDPVEAPPSHPEPVEGQPSLSRPHDPVEAPPSHPEPVEGQPSLSRPPSSPTPTFEKALEPVARRMERVNLPAEFLAKLLDAGSDVHLTDAAMRWAGMPNKNERAAMEEALQALAAGGFLESTGDESWRVLRSAQS